MKKHLLLLLSILFATSPQALEKIKILNSDDCLTSVEISEQDNDSQNSGTLKSHSFGAFPIFFYTDETRLAGGIGVQVVYPGKSVRRSSTVGMIGFYTQNKQYIFQVVPELCQG